MKIRVSPSGKVAFVGNMRIDREQEVEYTPEIARKMRDGEIVSVKKSEKTEVSTPAKTSGAEQSQSKGGAPQGGQK